MYGSLDIRCNRQSFLRTIFRPFDPPKNLENQNFDKMKKTNYWRYYHLYHKCINENHMMYGPLYMECDTEFFLTLNHFLPFYFRNNQENHKFDKMKKTTQDIILCMCTINENHMMYVSWDMKHDKHTFLLFWAIFALLPH